MIRVILCVCFIFGFSLSLNAKTDVERGIFAYDNGNYEVAMRYFHKACLDDVMNACCFYGRTLRAKDNPNRDLKKAQEIFDDICAKGHHGGCIEAVRDIK